MALNLLKMMFMILFSAVFASLLASPDTSLDDLWKAYKVKHMKFYDEKSDEIKRKVWERNVRMVAQHNLEADIELHGYRLELNKFSDMTKCELDVYRRCFSMGNQSEVTPEIYFTCDRACFMSLPSYVDWREKKAVTPVKDQGECGSCWAFSSVGALEGQNKIRRGTLVSLSEQNLVDCSHKEGNNGCDGGRMDFAFQYVIDNQGIDTERSYPYKATDGHCRFLRSEVGANCTQFVGIRKGSEKQLKAAVANIGPISVAIDASSVKFMNYKEGIYYDKTCSHKYLDHAVLVVGYGTSRNGSDYWIVKNSWGTNWGMGGYILMARNAHNMCGIASFAFYPVV